MTNIRIVNLIKIYSLETLCNMSDKELKTLKGMTYSAYRYLIANKGLLKVSLTNAN